MPDNYPGGDYPDDFSTDVELQVGVALAGTHELDLADEWDYDYDIFRINFVAGTTYVIHADTSDANGPYPYDPHFIVYDADGITEIYEDGLYPDDNDPEPHLNDGKLEFVYTPQSSFVGFLELGVDGIDDGIGSYTITLSTKEGVIAHDDTFVEIFNSADPTDRFVTGNVLANESSPPDEGDFLETFLFPETGEGFMNLFASGSFVFVPDECQFGDGDPATADVWFQYQAVDATGQDDTGTIGISLISVDEFLAPLRAQRDALDAEISELKIDLTQAELYLQNDEDMIGLANETIATLTKAEIYLGLIVGSHVAQLFIKSWLGLVASAGELAINQIHSGPDDLGNYTFTVESMGKVLEDLVNDPTLAPGKIAKAMGRFASALTFGKDAHDFVTIEAEKAHWNNVINVRTADMEKQATIIDQLKQDISALENEAHALADQITHYENCSSGNALTASHDETTAKVFLADLVGEDDAVVVSLAAMADAGGTSVPSHDGGPASDPAAAGPDPVLLPPDSLQDALDEQALQALV